MPRTVEGVLEPGRVAAALERLGNLDGVVGLRVHDDVSVDPPGSLVTLTATSDQAERALWILVEEETTSITIDEPRAVSVPSGQAAIEREGDECSWDERCPRFCAETETSP